ncbi:hypothetical protein JMJ56_25455 [Belnapia sp. T18]|uniref:Uncharacterized protein n=1 Tax=Belnapia arida TaxID=2804533 RepID=A0ABS1U9I6_9PROT|nr:hypothetical protein [Belnapia arida]MBL6081347.1 hypothetical protein [Belnapia arida]
MADILPFSVQRRAGAAHYRRQPLSQPARAGDDLDASISVEPAAADCSDLGAVASLAEAPSRTLAALTGKVEVLVSRLADEDADAGLCVAEAKLLRSVLQDLRAFAAASAASLLTNVQQAT